MLGKEVVIAQHNTHLKVAAGSVGRYVRRAWTAGEAILLLGNWHIRVPELSVVFLRPSDGPLPFSWANSVTRHSTKWREARPKLLRITL